MVELVRGTFVFLYEDQLKLATKSAKTMMGLARLLRDVFFSTDVQKKSNLSGENGLQKLDPVIVNAIISKYLFSFTAFDCRILFHSQGNETEI